jgi:hypothetical protein
MLNNPTMIANPAVLKLGLTRRFWHSLLALPGIHSDS